VKLALVLLTAAAIAPFWSGELILATDLPQHLASAAIARDFPARGLDQFYAVDLTPRPYLGTTYLLWALGADQLAARLALSLYAIALVLAVAALISSAPGRDPRLLFLAPLFIASWPLAYGFLPFVFGLPPACAALAFAEKKPLWILVILHLLALLFHPLAFAIGAVGTLVFVRTRPRVLIPLVLAALFSLVPSDAPAIASDEHITTAWRFQIKHKVLAYAFAYLPGHLDMIAVLLAVVAFVCALVARRKTKPDTHDVLALVLLAIYLVAPADLSISGHKISLLGPRLLIVAWIGALLFARTVPRFLPFAAGASVLASSALLTFSAYHYGETWGPRVEAAIAELPEGAAFDTKIAAPNNSAFNTRLLAPPEQHLHAYAMLKRASYDASLFSTRQSPVQLKLRPEVTLSWTQTATSIAVSVR
jgi:hypothetical protein